jgi:hydroxypyruvate isomerase
MDWSYTNKTYFVDNFRIHIMAGKKFSGIVDTAMDDVYKDNLEYAAKVFKEKGLIGLIEPISDIVIPNYFMNSVSKGKSFPCPAEA